jgi:3-oxoacyl-[acyl-carrier-protein] synthase I
MKNTPIYMTHLGIVCALGHQHAEIRKKVFTGHANNLSFTDAFSETVLPLGVVNSPLPSMNEHPAHEQTRCNQLLLAAMEQIRDAFEGMRQHIAPLRIGIILGTSTSGIAEGEQAFAKLIKTGNMPEDFSYQQQEISSPLECLANLLDIKGPTYTISTACSSSAKALASARRLLRMNVCDLVIAGGVDSLCQLTVHGFSALESVSAEPCQPFSQSRNGINIGEGAALFLLSKDKGPVVLAGVGENSDAHHISAPDPKGVGAANAIELSLKDAGISAANIDYVNCHGTATLLNDKMESLAIVSALGNKVPCSSTKPYTGHCLGAAGAIEAGICWLSLTQPSHQHYLPVHLWNKERDDEIAPLRFVSESSQASQLNYALSNSFAFGGNNISLILERVS